MELVKTNEMTVEWMAKLKGIFNLPLSGTKFAFMTFEMNFNSTVIWRQFLTVSLFFLNKDVIVPQTSDVKCFHVRTKFLPVPDNHT